MIVALTRPTGAELSRCELTHLARAPISIDRAAAQHAAYLAVLAALGVTVVELPRLPNHPDAVFVEDTALVLDEAAVLLRPGAVSRRGEVASVAAVLAEYRDCLPLPGAGTLDGGDIVVFGKRILVGETTRSDAAGIAALEQLVSRLGYTVEPVPVRGVLHLKSAATVVDDDTLIHTPQCVDLSSVGATLLAADPGEPQGANVVRVGDALLADAAAPRTLATLAEHGAAVVPVDVSEFAKAEGAISCKSIIFSP